ncbi:MAG: ComF family protein [Gammaproteobacteria bacterium]
MYTYEYPVDALIWEMKFRQRPEIAYALAQKLYSRQVEHPGSRPDVIIPVPLHKRRMMQRGYNQALELSRAINKYSGIPIDGRSCRRVRHTAPQITLPAKQRKTNVRGVFEISGPIDYRYAVIVDDVITTYSTVNEIASLLIRAGVKRVCVWALARAGFNKTN